MGTRVSFVICLLPLSARPKQGFFQSVDRPGVDPKTAGALIAHN